jgi:hypothetical protein
MCQMSSVATLRHWNGRSYRHLSLPPTVDARVVPLVGLASPPATGDDNAPANEAHRWVEKQESADLGGYKVRYVDSGDN